MSIYNYLLIAVDCPHCHHASEVAAEFRFGLRDLVTYRLGDVLAWEGKGVRTPRTRPENGDYDGDAYAVCPRCGRDFWLVVTVRGDRLRSAAVDPSRPGYLDPE